MLRLASVFSFRAPLIGFDDREQALRHLYQMRKCVQERGQAIPGDRIAPRTPSSRTSLIFTVILTWRSKKVGDDKIGYFATQSMTTGEVKSEMLSGEDSAQGRFFGGSGEARE